MTLLELIVVMGIVGILLLVLLSRNNPDGMLLRRAGNELQLVLQQARMEAIKRNAEVLMDFRPEDILSCLDENQSGTCDVQEAPLRTWRTAEYQGLNYQMTFPGNMLWSPAGFPKQTGTGFAAGSILLKKKERALKVIMSSGGRIRQEEVKN
ncbi:GspH/FimT family protein [Deinococcus cellulosilyticus]